MITIKGKPISQKTIFIVVLSALGVLLVGLCIGLVVALTPKDIVAGDGTTTATLLAQAIIREGLKNLAAGANPMVLRSGIEAATSAAVAVSYTHLDVYKRQPLGPV